MGVSGSTNFRNVGISTFKSNMLTAIKKAEENAHVKYKSQDLDEKMRSFDIKDDGKFIPEEIADKLLQ